MATFRENEDVATLIHEVWAAQMVNRSSVAALAFLVWDVLITLEDEVDCVWRRSWAWTKALFLFVRYFAVAVLISLLFVGTEITALLHFTAHECYIWFVYQAVAVQVLISSVEIVLMLRVQALYAHSPFLINTLRVLFLIEVAAMGACIHYTLKGLEFNEVCIVTESSDAIIGYGVAAILFEFILFALTLIKFGQALRNGWGDAPVVRLLVRDGTWWFGLIFLSMLINGICYTTIRGGLSAVAFCWLITILSFSGSHLMLNMLRLAPSFSPRSHGNIHDGLEYGYDSHYGLEPEDGHSGHEHGKPKEYWNGRGRGEGGIETCGTDLEGAFRVGSGMTGMTGCLSELEDLELVEMKRTRTDPAMQTQQPVERVAPRASLAMPTKSRLKRVSPMAKAKAMEAERRDSVTLSTIIRLSSRSSSRFSLTLSHLDSPTPTPNPSRSRSCSRSPRSRSRSSVRSCSPPFSRRSSVSAADTDAYETARESGVSGVRLDGLGSGDGGGGDKG